MSTTGPGRQVATLLLPHLPALLGRSEGARPSAGPHRTAARRLWRDVAPHVAVRPDLARALDEALVSPGPASRQRLVDALEVLLAEDPVLAGAVGRRLDRVARRRQRRLMAAAAAGAAGVVLAALAGAGSSDPDVVALSGWVLAGLGAVLALVALYQLLRRYSWAKWMVMLLVIAGVLAVFANAETVEEDADNAKLFGIAVLSLLPAWLYLQFVAVRGRSLWEDYVVNLFRLGIDAPANLPEPPRGSGEHLLWERAGGPRREEAGLVYRRKFEAAPHLTRPAAPPG